MAHDGGVERGRRDRRQQIGGLGQRLGRQPQRRVELAARATEIERQRASLDAAPLEQRRVVAVALRGRDAAGRGVRVAEHAQQLELGQLVAHGRRRGDDGALLDQRAGADRHAGLDVGLDDTQEQRFLARGERLVGVHAITLETTSFASRRPR